MYEVEEETLFVVFQLLVGSRLANDDLTPNFPSHTRRFDSSRKRVPALIVTVIVAGAPSKQPTGLLKVTSKVSAASPNGVVDNEDGDSFRCLACLETDSAEGRQIV